MKHKDEIIRWANCPEGTEIWYREGRNEWDKVMATGWLPNVKYIVDDKYAELRKAQADGKTILYLGEEAYNLNFYKKLENYSIKEDFTPVLKRSIEGGRIVCFTSKTEAYYIDTKGLPGYKPGDRLTDLINYDNEHHWEDVK